MVDRVEASVEEGLKDPTIAPEETGNAENEMILGKFKSYEDLEKAYKNLESKLGERSQNAPEEPNPLPPQPRAEDEWQQDLEAGDDQPPPEEIKAALPGFTNDQIEDLSRYAWENKSLSDEHYESLERAGYSREIVDQYMQGQFAMAEAAQSQLINAGGGQERVQAMFEWAAQNLDQGTVDAYNTKFDQGGSDAIMAMEHLAAKYDASGEGATKNRVVGANAGYNDGPEPYRSVAQVTEAMSDPRYHTDPAYRAEVAERLKRSSVL